MRGENLVTRTKSFVYECVLFCETLPNTYFGNHVKGQLIRCATSVAANYRATRLAQTKAGFIAKLSIVIEESDESEFWLDFLLLFNYGNKEKTENLLKEAHELTSIFIASRKTAQRNKV